MILSINCRGRLLEFPVPVVMGIINLTPDSFYRKSRVTTTEVLKVAEKMILEGAAILDVGAVSSRPGAEEVSETEELNRLKKTVKVIRKEFPESFLSVDTFRAGVAKYCLEEGFDIINDISAGLLDDQMIDILQEYQPGYVLMHMKGLPPSMHLNPQYIDLIREIMDFFAERLQILHHADIWNVILDPGFGFGKTIQHNFEILRNFSSFRIFECPLIAGISRKSMIWKSLKIDPENALNGTTALHMIALQNGASILRAHDVEPAVQSIKLYQRYIETGKTGHLDNSNDS